MKILILMLVLVSCGQAKRYTDKPQVADFINESEYLTLEATKSYHPSNSVSNIQRLASSKDVVVPNKIKVTEGNSGNYYALVKLDDVTCYYKGGSIYSYPLQMGIVEEINNGKEYKLEYCSDSNGRTGHVAGDRIIVNDSITLSIHNGDSTVPTNVSVTVELI